MGNINSHALDDMRENEKNLCCLFVALHKSGPVAIAFAEIYILLNNLGPGQTVREYWTDVLCYNSNKYSNIFSTKERTLLQGSFDPKLQDISFLYKLLFYVCGLSPDKQNWKDPTYALEFNLHRVKNLRNDIMHERSELTEVELQTILEDMEQNVSAAIRLAGVQKYRDVSTQDNAFKSKLHTCRLKMKTNLFGLIADSIRMELCSIATGGVGIPSESFGFGFASGSTGIAPASGVPMAAGISDFGSFGAASAYAGEFGHRTSKSNEQIGRDELMELLKETEELEFYGVIPIIRRQLDLLNN